MYFSLNCHTQQIFVPQFVITLVSQWADILLCSALCSLLSSHFFSQRLLPSFFEVTSRLWISHGRGIPSVSEPPFCHCTCTSQCASGSWAAPEGCNRPKALVRDMLPSLSHYTLHIGPWKVAFLPGLQFPGSALCGGGWLPFCVQSQTQLMRYLLLWKVVNRNYCLHLIWEHERGRGWKSRFQMHLRKHFPHCIYF